MIPIIAKLVLLGIIIMQRILRVHLLIGLVTLRMAIAEHTMIVAGRLFFFRCLLHIVGKKKR